MASLPRTGDTATDRALDVLGQWIRDVERTNVFANSTTLTGITLGTTAKDVPHGLGRVPQRWSVLDQDANAVIWRSGKADASVLPLKASATVTVTLVIR